MCNTVMWGYDDEHITPGASLMAANTGGEVRSGSHPGLSSYQQSDARQRGVTRQWTGDFTIFRERLHRARDDHVMAPWG